MRKLRVLGGHIRKKDYVLICQNIPREWKVSAIERTKDKGVDLLFCFAGETCRLSLGRYALGQKFQTIWNAWNKYNRQLAVQASRYYIDLKLNERSFIDQLIPCTPTDPVALAAYRKDEAKRERDLKNEKREHEKIMADIEAEQLAYRRKKIATWLAKGVPLSNPPKAKTFAQLLLEEDSDA